MINSPPRASRGPPSGISNLTALPCLECRIINHLASVCLDVCALYIDKESNRMAQQQIRYEILMIYQVPLPDIVNTTTLSTGRDHGERQLQEA